MLILVPILLALWSLGWFLRPRLAGAAPAAEWEPPSPDELSVVIPARNEAHNLPRLLQSLRDQPQPPHEILVVDDGSTDGTAAIATAHGAKVIASAPLPDGWRGKTWACHQGASQATASHLLFLDADTWLEAGGLEHILNHHRGGALSVGPWHAVERPYESLSLFFNLAMVIGTVPNGLFGQSLLIERGAYHQAGGHEAVKSHVLENVHLQPHLTAQGTPSFSLPGHGMLSFRMYPSGIAEMIEGWTKGFASGAGRTPGPVMLTLVLWMNGLIGTFIGLVLARDPMWALLYLAFAAQTYMLARKVGGFPWWSALLYPLPLMFFFFVFTRSALKGGKQVTWKGRTIDAG